MNATPQTAPPDNASASAKSSTNLFRRQQAVVQEFVEAKRRQAVEAQALQEPANSGPAQPPQISATLQDGAIFAAVCEVTGTDPSDRFPLATQIGLPAGFCQAWSGMGPDARAACAHTFQHANTSELLVSRAEACGAAIGDALGLTSEEFMSCVRDPTAVPSARCAIALRPALVLGDNPPAAEQVRRSTVQASARALSTADEAGDIRAIRDLVHKPEPTPDDVFRLSALCRWNQGPNASVAANEILARDFLSLPHMAADGLDRTICTEANHDCAHFTTVAEMCHAVQNKYANNAMRLKVDEAGGRANLMPGQRLAAAQLIYPEPYGSTFLDIAATCGSDRLQGEVAQTLQSQYRRFVSGHANICANIQRTTSILVPMDEGYTQLASMGL